MLDLNYAYKKIFLLEGMLKVGDETNHKNLISLWEISTSKIT